jgi:hypothetical protein
VINEVVVISIVSASFWELWMNFWAAIMNIWQTDRFLEKDKHTARSHGSKIVEATTSTDYFQLMKTLGQVKNHLTYLSWAIETRLIKT